MNLYTKALLEQQVKSTRRRMMCNGDLAARIEYERACNDLSVFLLLENHKKLYKHLFRRESDQ